ncbi:hypothetical protein KJA16_02805, partial [Patescibacteria group bacterium]|nr:hypothetical protein [Patescibacteria group bacterium]
MAKIIKNALANFLVICLIFLMITVWIFSGWPQIWQKPSIPPEIQEVFAATEVKKPTTSTLDLGTAFTNPGNAYDLPDTGGDESTNADQYNAVTSIYRWHTWATKGQTSYTATVLKVKWDTSGGFTDDHFAIEATKDGTNWNLVLVADGVHNETTIQTAQVSLDTDQDLTQVQVRVNFVKVGGGDKDSLYIYDIWTEGTYTPPTLSITAPENVQMPDYTLGGAGYSERNFEDVSGLVRVDANVGFTVTVSSTALTSTNNTIPASDVKLKTDQIVSTNPTKIVSCTGFTPTEPTADEYALDTAKNVVTATLGTGGTCDIYPTIRV